MKKGFMCILALLLASSVALAADFSPTLLKLSADPVIQYNFDGSELKIPVQVSGTPAGIIFSVFTKGKANEISPVQNGYLGWHYVNKIDTCIYYSPLYSFTIGAQQITWDGKDQDGNIVPPGEYTYYLWAFDNQSARVPACKAWEAGWAFDYKTAIQEVDENGLPLDNPIIYRPDKRWTLGGDPEDETLMETTIITLPEGWISHESGNNNGGEPLIDPHNFDFFYILIGNKDATTCGIQKYKWVPGGESELQTDFGENGLSETYTAQLGAMYQAGLVSDGDYIYCAGMGLTNNEPDSDFFVYDWDGFKVDHVDLTVWWSCPECFEAGAQMNGGPSNIYQRHGKVFLNSLTSCMDQMVDPGRYLDSGDPEDFFVWTNQNGDYVLDHNFEETAQLPWVCMDYNVGPYTYSITSDDNLWTAVCGYDAGAVSFGLLAPDGTGVGYMAFAGETAGFKTGPIVLDGNTPFDGLYTDYLHLGGPHYDIDKDKQIPGLWFLAHDSIKGVLTNAVAVEDDAPAAFSVEQNTPNPFNPTTTISFSLAEAGNVTIEVYNVAGQKVDTIVNEYMDAGSHSVVWDASSFSAGVYFYTVKSGDYSKTMKMTLLK